MVINLDSNFNPYPKQKAIEFKLFYFTGGEPHIKINTDQIDTNQVVTITHRINDFCKVAEILLAVDALKRVGFKKVNLTIPYFPGARQDRIMTKGEPLTIKIYTNIINSCKLEKVTIYDPHSDVVSALLDQCEVVSNTKFIEQVIKKLDNNVLLVSPDAGAFKKVNKLASHFKKHEVVECSKTRNVHDGTITKLKVLTDDLKEQDCLIIDDICDGGKTFLHLAKALKAKNAGKLHLAVSHGIFSKNLQALNQVYDRIFTTDSFQNLKENDQLTQIKLSNGLLP